MTESHIVVRNLSKTYRVPEREPGLGSALKSLVHRTYRDVEAVRDISFTIEMGEMVGFIGPNGAGKTTTLKMLSGLLHPTSGDAHVLGAVPWKREHAYLQHISMVLGNKSQMLWDIPPLDSFRTLADIYGVSLTDYQSTLDELVILLDMKELLTKPVRNFSLGERMKCELVAGLLHRPDILFLDEPTLGLDVSMQARLRRFFAEYNRRSGVTVILTSHYMADVVALCPRVILIHHGQLLYDGALQGLAEKLAPFKLIKVALSRADTQSILTLPDTVDVVERQNGNLTLRVPRPETPRLTAHLLNTLPVVDLTVEDPPIEAVIDQIYQEGKVEG
ncbi:MAG: ATP-binding cassette domain-containing protein [Anaerolineae bacterium]|nr:ATP-binding cassette domain-containing protein [Anaerolineae bacterium]